MKNFLILSNILYARSQRRQQDLEALQRRAVKDDELTNNSEKPENETSANSRNTVRIASVAGSTTKAGDDDHRGDRGAFRSRARSHLHTAKDFILERETNADEKSEHQATYRWLPIFSGIVIPFSILLEIPGLTEHWYIVTENNQTIETRKNSALLDAGMSVSMACAIIANIAIVFRFLERKVRTSTLIAIATLTIHDVINICAVTIFAVQHRFNDGFTFGQSYWFTVCSTIASTATNVSLIVDYVRTPDFAWSSSGLTSKQRSLVIVVMVLLCWIAFGGLINSLLMGLDFIDGLYFTVVTIETVGFGDIFPKSTGSRIFAAFHGTIGTLILALTVTTCNRTVVESFQFLYKKRLTEMLQRHKEHKDNRRWMRAKNIALKKQLEQAGLPIYVESYREDDEEHHHHLHLSFRMDHQINESALTPQQKANAMREAHEIFDKRTMQTMKTDGHSSHFSFDTSIDELFAQELQRDTFVKLSIVLSTFMGFWLVGAAIFMATEGWSYGIAMWFCFETFSTIGYGDRTPQTPAGRSVFIVWALHGIGTMTILISVLNEIYDTSFQKILTRKVKEPVEGAVEKIAGNGSKFENRPPAKPTTTDDSFFAPRTEPSIHTSTGRGWVSLPNLPRHADDESSSESESDSGNSDSSYSVDPRRLARQDNDFPSGH